MREIKFRAWVDDARQSTKQDEWDRWFKENAGKRVFVESFISDNGYNPFADKFMVPAPFMDYNVIVEKGKYAYGEGMEIYGHKDYPLMQYTGLKDKNDKEIYEGDILAEWDNGLETVERFVVKWHGDDGYPAFDIEPNHFDGCNALSFYAQSCEGFEIEVIGNIWEHPDLLK